MNDFQFRKPVLFFFFILFLVVFRTSPVLAFVPTATIGLGKAPIVESLLRYTGATIEVGGVVIMVGGVLLSSGIVCRKWWNGKPFETLYRDYRSNLGRAIMLGLEVLIVADIVGTVAVTPSMENLKVLGFIILIRTFLSFALEIEINGYWPWRKKETEMKVESNT